MYVMHHFEFQGEAYAPKKKRKHMSSWDEENDVTNPFGPRPTHTEQASTQTERSDGGLPTKETIFEKIQGLDAFPRSSLKTGRLEAVDYEPVGMGGEHIVMDHPKYRVGDVEKKRTIVTKVNFRKSLQLLRAHFQGPEARKKAIQSMEEAMDQRRKKLQELREYFGYSAVPQERFYIQDVPITKELISDVFPGFLKDEHVIPETLPVWTSVQRRLDFDEAKVVSLTGYYPEIPHDSQKAETDWYRDAYDTAHDILVGRDTGGLSRDQIREAILKFYPKFKKIDQKIQQDPSFREKLRSVVRAMIKYVRETGTVLDLAGKDNVILLDTPHGWELKMPDPLLIRDCRMKSLDDIGPYLARDEEMPRGLDSGEALNVLNAVRVINALAALSDIRDRLTVPSLKKIPASRWRERYGWESRRST